MGRFPSSSRMPAEKQTIIAVIMGLSKTHETCPYTSVIPFMVGTWDLSPKLSAPELSSGMERYREILVKCMEIPKGMMEEDIPAVAEAIARESLK